MFHRKYNKWYVQASKQIKMLFKFSSLRLLLRVPNCRSIKNVLQRCRS